MTKTTFKYVVVGGGTAGWLTALYLNKIIPYSDVTVIASSEIGILGAGEGTTPHFISFLKELEIDEQSIIDNAKGTIKKGIKFTNWNGDGNHYSHPFFDDKHALHFNANLLASHLKDIAISRGVKFIDDEVIRINNNKNGEIESFDLKSDINYPCDFVFDCSGFKRLVIGKHYHSNWISYSNKLPVNRAMPFFLPNDNVNFPDYTESIAMKHGWVWKIPVQGRYGCGYVFDSHYATDEEIKQELKEYLQQEIVSPKMFSFNAGFFEQTWIKNCIAIGLSAGFTEPLEATSIWTSIFSLYEFNKFKDGIIYKNKDSVVEYNEMIKSLNSDMSNFIHLHYLTNRNDTNFWKEFSDKNPSPEFIDNFKGLFKKTTPTSYDMDYLHLIEKGRPNYLRTFDIRSWLSIANGIGIK